jgi:hypothetical protein
MTPMSASELCDWADWWIAIGWSLRTHGLVAVAFRPYLCLVNALRLR